MGQVSIGNLNYDEMYNVYGEVASRGLSKDSLKKLPCHVILDEMNAEQNNYCTICLQVILASTLIFIISVGCQIYEFG